MSNIDTTRRFATGVAVILPVIAFMLTKLLGVGAGDVIAEESEIAASSVAGNGADSTRIIEQFGEVSINAAIRARDLNRNNYPGNPFYYQKRIVADVPVFTDEFPEIDPGIPYFVLTAIMGGSKAIAVINEQLCIVGQKLEDGWVVKSIDIARECVVLSGPDGQSHTVYTNNDNDDDN